MVSGLWYKGTFRISPGWSYHSKLKGIRLGQWEETGGWQEPEAGLVVHSPRPLPRTLGLTWIFITGTKVSLLTSLESCGWPKVPSLTEYRPQRQSNPVIEYACFTHDQLGTTCSLARQLSYSQDSKGNPLAWCLQCLEKSTKFPRGKTGQHQRATD